MPPRHFIEVDRDAHTLTLHKRNRFGSTLRKHKTWPVAVGMVGRRTPRGLYVIDDRDRNPSWTVPWGVDWMPEELWGKTLPPGPENPIQGRWLGLKDAAGVGIHGIPKSEYASIGQDASHGCVRMKVADILELYPSATLRTPVYIA